VRFTATEGTWLSVGVSPDGRTLVFDLLGDLYLLPITGGRAKRITSGPAIDAQPRYSPDGRAIVFTSDRDGSENVWLINADGSAPLQLTHDRNRQIQSPVWTPDGDSIVVVQRTRFAHQAAHLRIFPRYGGRSRAIHEVDPSDMWQGPAFGSDSRWLWHTRMIRDSTAAPGVYRTYNQLSTYDRVSGRDSVLPTVRGGAMRPVLSRDGKWLVYGSQRGDSTALMLRDLRTGAEQTLIAAITQSTPYVDETRDAMPGAAFTPDSRALVISNGGKLWRVAVPSGSMQPIPFTAEVEQQLAPLVRSTHRIGDSVYVVKYMSDVRFSPDDKRIAFTAIDRIWVMDWPDGTPRRLTDRSAGERYPVWSPDGRYIAFVSWNETSDAVFRARSDGTAPAPVERLTSEPGMYHRLNYTPDGSRIIVSRAPAPDPNTGRFARDSLRMLVWIPAGGGDSARIIGRDLDRWIFERESLPYVRADDPSRVHQGGYSMRWDGSDPRTVAENPYYRIALSPDGRYALFDDRDEDIALIPMPSGDSGITSVRMPSAMHIAGGGEFAGWSEDGRHFYYSLGTTVFRVRMSCVDSTRTRAPPLIDEACIAERRDVEIRVQPDRAAGTVVLRGAKLITMRGSEIIPDGDIVVRDGRLIAIGARNQVSVPNGAQIIDLSGAVVMPGLIDVHAHSSGYAGVSLPGLYHENAVAFVLPLAFGVTAQRDPQSSTTSVFAYTDIEAVGSMLSPRMFSTGPPIGSSNWSSIERAREWGTTITTPARAEAVVRRYAEHYRTTVLKEYTIGDRRVRQWLNQAADRHAMSVTSEGGRANLKSALGRMLDGYSGHEHYFAVAPLYDDVLRLMAASGIVYTPTLGAYAFGAPDAFEYYLGRYDVAGDTRLRRFLPAAVFDSLVALQKRSMTDDMSGFRAQAEALADIVEAGGRIAMGGHGSAPGLDAHFELWAMASGGLPAHDVLRAATLTGAWAIGREADLGSLEVGKLADLIVLNRDPLQDIRNSIDIRYVMKGGRLYESATLNEVWPASKPLPQQWWTPDVSQVSAQGDRPLQSQLSCDSLIAAAKSELEDAGHDTSATLDAGGRDISMTNPGACLNRV